MIFDDTKFCCIAIVSKSRPEVDWDDAMNRQKFVSESSDAVRPDWAILKVWVTKFIGREP